MNKIKEEKVNDIKKRYNFLAKLIHANKVLDEEEKNELMYAIEVILYIINKYVAGEKNV